MVDLDGAHLTCADIVAVAQRRTSVSLSAAARRQVQASHLLAERLAADRDVYGRSTGVGANRDAVVGDPDRHALGLLRSHATSAGVRRAPERVRAMLVVRLNQLTAGGSGASLGVLDALAEMLATDALPAVREYGSIGTGDLSALATTALALAGEGATSRPLPSRVAFGAGDALPFLSSNAATIGDAALACVDLQELVRAGVVVAALTSLAVAGNPEAFSEVVEQVTPFDGARLICRWMRELTPAPAAPARIQDPFGLRTLPQAHGAALDALDRLADTVQRLANAPAENPVVLAGGLAHHGGFHAAYLGNTLDAATIAVAQAGQLSLARLAMLTEPAFTGLPAFLSDGTPGASGVMVLEYVAASALGDLRAAATPAGPQSVVLSRGVEEDASFASLAARQAAAAVGALRVLLACELVAAVRAVRARGLTPAGPVSRALQMCADLPVERVDRDLTDDVGHAEGRLPALAGLL